MRALSHAGSITLRIQPESLGQKDSFPGKCAPLIEDRQKWVTSQNYRTRTAPHKDSTSFYKTVSALVGMIGTWGRLRLSCEACLVFCLVMPVSLGASWTLPQGTKLPPDNNYSLQAGILDQSAKTKFRTLVSMYLGTCYSRSVAWEKLTRGPLNLKVIFFYL